MCLNIKLKSFKWIGHLCLKNLRERCQANVKILNHCFYLLVEINFCYIWTDCIKKMCNCNDIFSFNRQLKRERIVCFFFCFWLIIRRSNFFLTLSHFFKRKCFFLIPKKIMKILILIFFKTLILVSFAISIYTTIR